LDHGIRDASSKMVQFMQGAVRAGCTVHGARGDAPEGKRNGNYRHGARTKEMIEVWKLIKSLR
jgi:hypothetical protein